MSQVAVFAFFLNILLLQKDQGCYMKPLERNRNHGEHSDEWQRCFSHQNCVKMKWALLNGPEPSSLSPHRLGRAVRDCQHSPLETTI